MRKRGLTLIELMVAMTIFIMVMTLAVGGFVSISRTRAVIGAMKDSQQKARVASEMIFRLAKQAEYVRFPGGGNDDIELYFDIDKAVPSAKKFARIAATQDLFVYDCNAFEVNKTCKAGSWVAGTSLLGGTSKGIYLFNTDVFDLHNVAPSILTINLNISNDLLLQNAVLLESLK
jgi:hypothetical protein